MERLELKYKDVQKALNNFFQENVFQYPIEIVFLYGSLVSGLPRSDSDIDLAILFSGNVDNAEEIYSLITEITYRLTMKLNKEVNIISIDRNFVHPMLYYNAIVLGEEVFSKDKDRFLSLKLEAIYQMEDFQIFGSGWQREIGRKLLREVI